MNGIYRKTNRKALRGAAWVGEAALFCLGLLAVLALVVVMALLTAVMLAAVVLPATLVWRGRDPRDRRDSEDASVLAAPRKAVAS